MCAVNMDAPFYQSKNPKKCLENSEKEKKIKYLKTCLQQRRHFTPFFTLVDSLLWVEAESTLKHITSFLRMKWQETYPRTYRYMKSRVRITLVRATHCCILGDMVPSSKISVKQPQWEDGAGLHLNR